MSRLPDLVHDTRLNTSFKDNITIHHYDESDDENGARSTLRLEHWEQTSHLGRGSYGEVWLQQCVSGKRGHEQRAVKIIPRLRLKDKRNSYVAELEAISKFSQRRYSKYFVKLLGWYDTDSSLYIAMEFAPFGDLENYISKNGPMPEGDAQEVSSQVLEGLSYMHRAQFAHRDIKPSNILIKTQPPEGKWWVKISDFGISKRIEGSKAQSTVKGTIQYMAPELIWHEAGNSINYMAADMWALGTMAYRMLTLMPVFPTLGAYTYYLVNVDSFPLEQLKKRDASPDAILFIRSLMRPLSEERLSSQNAIDHAWVASFKGHDTSTPAPTSSYSPSRQPTQTPNPNSWATISTRSTQFNIEAQQPRPILPRPAPPIPAPLHPTITASRLRFEQNRERQHPSIPDTKKLREIEPPKNTLQYRREDEKIKKTSSFTKRYRRPSPSRGDAERRIEDVGSSWTRASGRPSPSQGQVRRRPEVTRLKESSLPRRGGWPSPSQGDVVITEDARLEESSSLQQKQRLSLSLEDAKRKAEVIISKELLSLLQRGRWPPPDEGDIE